MARPATGQVVEKSTGRGVVFALRFRAYGQRQYMTLGGSWEGWTRERADEELLDVLAKVRLGLWERPAPRGTVDRIEPTFHEFASEWAHAQRLQGGKRGTGLSDKG